MDAITPNNFSCAEPRKTLLRPITEGDVTAIGWSSRKPCFCPEWVEKVPLTVA